MENTRKPSVNSPNPNTQFYASVPVIRGAVVSHSIHLLLYELSRETTRVSCATEPLRLRRVPLSLSDLVLRPQRGHQWCRNDSSG